MAQGGQIQAQALKTLIRDPANLVLDVREPAEYRYEHIEGTTNWPLSRLAAAAQSLPKNKTLYVLCQAGISSVRAAKTLSDQGFHACNVEGGLEAWKRAGYAVQRGGGVIPIMRQVQITAGSLVLIGSMAGLWWLAALVGAGLVFAGASGRCAMAWGFSKLPWNKAA